MLRLHSDTRENWITEVLQDIPALLLDHAHCEKKAASTAISFLFRYPEHANFMTPLSELAREELRHFEQVLVMMEQRGIAFERQVPSTYAKNLVAKCRRDEPDRMMDLMICASLIEARSCERMKILSEGLLEIDPKLAQFYKGLLACEARHHQIYVDLLGMVFDKDLIENRLEELAKWEKSLLTEDNLPARMHS